MAAVTPLTPRGVAVIVLSCLALWPFGFGSLDLVLFIVGLLGLALSGLAVILTVLGMLMLRRGFRDAADETPASLRLETGSLAATEFSISRLGRWPLIEVDWRWSTPARVHVRPRACDARWHEEIVAEGRCLTDAVVRRIDVFDVFGLTRLGFERHQSASVVVLPHLGRLRSAPLVRALASADGVPHPAGTPDGDRMEIRRYAPGDSIRHILWKTYARTRELNVRLPERSVERARKTVAYLVAGAGDEPAAAAARAALESGALGEGWQFGADGSTTPTTDVDVALTQIARSRGARDQSTALGGFLERVSPRGDAHCVVFVPAVDGAWTDAATHVAQQRRGGLTFVVATDGVSRPIARAWWRRFLMTTPPETGTPAVALGTLVRRLAQSGADVQVVDRPTGRQFGDAHMARLPHEVAA